MYTLELRIRSCLINIRVHIIFRIIHTCEFMFIINVGSDLVLHVYI